MSVHDQRVEAKEIELVGLNMLRQAHELSDSLEASSVKEAYVYNFAKAPELLKKLQGMMSKINLGAIQDGRLMDILSALLGDGTLMQKLKDNEAFQLLVAQGSPGMLDKTSLKDAISGLYDKVVKKVQPTYASVTAMLDSVAQELEDSKDEELKKLATQIDVISNTIDKE